MNVLIEQIQSPSMEEQDCEMVERKGLGHPDTVCDSIMEAISIALSQQYKKRWGRILHHNMDKGMVLGGTVERRFGGGQVGEPIRIVLGDRATFEFQGQTIPVNEIAIDAAKKWIRKNLRFVNPDQHVKYQLEIRPGSPELQDIFVRSKTMPGANDTSAAVGFAPLSQMESLVLKVERHLNSPAFKQAFPETGEDVKVMAIRNKDQVDLTIVMPLLDRFLRNERDYFRKKARILKEIENLVKRLQNSYQIHVALNPLDQQRRGMGGMYLSVLGTSAEDADSGEVGRGNRVNGLITFHRPTSLEAAAGKNPVSHVGKIYNVLANKLAHEAYTTIEGIREIYIWIVSQIGVRIDHPAMIHAKILLQPGFSFALISKKVHTLIKNELAQMSLFCDELASGKYSVV